MIESSAEYYFSEDKLGLLQHEFPSPPDSRAFASSFPSPTCSNTSSLDSPTLLFDPSALQNLPIAVLQSISALYQTSPPNLYFDENTHTDFFAPASTITTSTAATTAITTPSSNIISSPSITIPAGATEIPIAPLQKPTKTSRPPRQLECYNCHVTKTPLWRRTPDRIHSLCNACGLYYKQYGSHRPLHIRQKQQQQQQQQNQQQQNSAQPLVTLPLLGKKRSPEEELLLHSPAATTTTSSSSSGTMPFSRTKTTAAATTTETTRASMSHTKYDQVIMDDQSCSNCKQTNTPLWRKNERGESVCNACGLYARLHHCDRPPTMHKQKVQKRRRQESITSDSSNNTHPTDERFNDLLGRMNPDQMQSFLVILESRCALLRSILYGEDFQMQHDHL